MRRLLWVGATLAMAATLAIGCGRSDKTVYNGPGGKVSVKTEKAARGVKQTVDFESKEGKASVTTGENRTVSEAELGAPVYPGAKVQMAGNYQSSKASEDSVQQHILTTSDDFDKVVEFYKSHLKGIKDQQTITSGDDKMAIFTLGKDKARTMVHINWNAKEKQTMIQVMKQGM